MRRTSWRVLPTNKASTSLLSKAGCLKEPSQGVVRPVFLRNIENRKEGRKSRHTIWRWPNCEKQEAEDRKSVIERRPRGARQSLSARRNQSLFVPYSVCVCWRIVTSRAPKSRSQTAQGLWSLTSCSECSYSSLKDCVLFLAVGASPVQIR